MAATPFDPSLLGINFDIYNDGALASRTTAINLPGGACNFVDLTPGAQGTRCGCRRFWSRPPVPGRPFVDALSPDQFVWCMCSHHACYHDEVRAGDAPAAAPGGVVAGQENERPKTGREPLTPVQDLSFRLPSGVPASLEFPEMAGLVSFTSKAPAEAADSREQASPQPDPSLPDTLSWGDFMQSQAAPPPTLPPIPSQCLMPSQAPSETSTSRAKYLRPFAGRGLNTLSGVSGSKLKSPVQEGPVLVNGAWPMTMVAHGDADADTLTASGSPDPAGDKALVPFRTSGVNVQHLSATVLGHEQRLDRLETVSFTAAGHEECHDKHDQMDLRVTDLEVRLEEVEKGMNDNASFAGHRLLRREAFDESNASIISGSTNATNQRISASELFHEVESLKAQFSQLQSSLPTPQQPWEIEVVFLPFPLRRVWQDIDDFKEPPNADEWTQLPNTHSTSSVRAHSPLHADWEGPNHQYEWLLPRACGSGSLLDKRLRSRGLVRNVSVNGPDARSVLVAMSTAFGNMLQQMSDAFDSSRRRRSSVDARVARFLGLQQSWVPLRKVHKDSRLRFLTPDEMITPALWNKQFLDTVIMKSATPRMFITQPEAYIQDDNSYERGWTWQRLRELPRVYFDVRDSTGVPEEDAREECWTFNETLDDAPSTHSSHSSLRPTLHRISTSPSQHYFTGRESLRSSSPAFIRGQTPIRERRASSSRPLRIRTGSMPPAPAAPLSAAPRRVVSGGQFPRSRAGTPQIRSGSGAGMMGPTKRRRTRSPSYPRNTPRWTASPSPIPPQAAARNTTPFYYATPYSNGPLTEPRLPQTEGSNHSGDGEESGPEGQGEAGPGSTTEPYSDDDSVVDVRRDMVTHTTAEATAPNDSQRWQLPEDEPWPGIEDRDRMSDGENIDPMEEGSDNSSQPSEYPSTQQAWHLAGADINGAGFRIHEDEEMKP